MPRQPTLLRMIGFKCFCFVLLISSVLFMTLWKIMRIYFHSINQKIKFNFLSLRIHRCDAMDSFNYTTCFPVFSSCDANATAAHSGENQSIHSYGISGNVGTLARPAHSPRIILPAILLAELPTAVMPCKSHWSQRHQGILCCPGGQEVCCSLPQTSGQSLI